MGVRTTGGAILTEEVIGLPLVDIVTLVMVVRIIDRQVQLYDTVATRSRRSQRVDINTALHEVFAVESEWQVVLTNLLVNDLANGWHYRDGSDIDTIVSVFCTRVVVIRAAFGNVVAVLPGVRCLTLADSNLFRELIRVMYNEVQAVNAVASKFGLETETVLVGSV